LRRRGGGTHVVGLDQPRQASPVLNPTPAADARAELHCFRRFRGDGLLTAERGLPPGQDLFQCIVVQGDQTARGLQLEHTILNPALFPDCCEPKVRGRIWIRSLMPPAASASTSPPRSWCPPKTACTGSG